jgi:hypothetical protein
MLRSLSHVGRRLVFKGSAPYWDRRYRRGGDSGAGSYGEQAAYKAEFLNRLVADRGIERVIEFGSGDGNQLTLADYKRYLGLDVSETAVRQCVARFAGDATKSFALYRSGLFADPAGFLRADMTMSLDVIYHLIEDEVFDRYMHDLFGAARRAVVIYATDGEDPDPLPHVRHRRFSEWITARAPAWHLTLRVTRPEQHFKDFFVYEPHPDGDAGGGAAGDR